MECDSASLFRKRKGPGSLFEGLSLRRVLVPALGHSEALLMSFQNDEPRPTGEVTLKTIFLLQIAVGALANGILFFHSVSPVLLGRKLRPTHTILIHMAVANSLVLLSTGIPHTMATFISRQFLPSLGRKLVHYVHQTAHRITLHSTCVLSAYWLIALIPRRAEWTMPRGSAPRVTGSSCYICWIFSVLISICVPEKITSLQDMHSYVDTQGRWFCSTSILTQALSSCGQSLMPCSLASWSGAVAPRCSSCSDTTGECSTATPPTGITHALRRPEPPTPS